MNLEEKISVLLRLSPILSDEHNEELIAIKRMAKAHNPWFTSENVNEALKNICTCFLDKTLLEAWTKKYSLHNVESQKRIGLVLAGNIPLVGFHDILCVFITDNICSIKLSSKDKTLTEYVIKKMIELDPRCEAYFEIVERLENFDAVIATGSNNASRYFEKYFSSYPHIIRRNRTAVAILEKDISDEDLMALGKDVFSYFGLGCRNVSKLYLEEGFEIERIMKHWEEAYKGMLEHTKYKNNYDYSYALYLLNKDLFFANEVVILQQTESVFSRIACVGYEYFESETLLQEKLQAEEENIQCIVTQKANFEKKSVAFGESQNPSLVDYADGIDTIQFLLTV